MGNPSTFKEELPAPMETLIKAGWCTILLCLVGCGKLLSGSLYERTIICIAQMGASNTAGPQSDGFTVQAQSEND